MTPQLIFVTVIIIALGSGGLLLTRLSQHTNKPSLENILTLRDKLSPEPTSSPALEPSITDQPEPTPALPTKKPQPKEAQPTSQPNLPSNQDLISQLLYPGASVNSQSANLASLQASGDASIITNWYKEKLIALGGRSRSFVTTTTNGQVNHQLSATVNSDSVSVKIEGQSGGQLNINISVTQ